MITYTAEERLRADTWNLAYRAINEHRAWQNVAELAEVLYLVAQEDPTVVVEIGSAWGGTLHAWRGLPTVPLVYGVTMRHYGFPPDREGITVLEGDSHDRATLQRLKDQMGGRWASVLFIDGDHTFDGVVADWRMYGPLVAPGGLVLFHDVRCAGEEAVRQAWETVIVPEVEAAGGRTTEIVATAGKPLGFGIARTGRDHA